jgi:hypothetical protein
VGKEEQNLLEAQAMGALFSRSWGWENWERAILGNWEAGLIYYLAVIPIVLLGWRLGKTSLLD